VIVSAHAADFEALAVTVAVARAQQQETDELEGRRRSRAAFRRWKERLPVALSEDGDVDILVARHRDYWLRSAEGFVRGLDPEGLGLGSVYAVDFETVGIKSDRFSGFALPVDAFDIFREVLPRGARPGPVVAVNVKTETRCHSRNILETASDLLLRATVRVGITGTVLHEVAHVVDFIARGQSLPLASNLDHVRQGIAALTKSDNATHGDTWVRAFGHLVFRASVRPPVDFWSRLFAFDVEQHYEGPGEEILDALVPELLATSSVAPLVDVVRSPAHPSFVQFLASRRKPQE